MLALITERLNCYQPKRIDRELPEAGVLIAITDEASPEVVLTKRARQLSSHSGEIAFPGGKRDFDDLTIVHTALREAEEEVNLRPDQVNIIGRLDERVSLHQLKVTPCVGIIPANTLLLANVGELDSVFKVPLDFFLNDINRCDHLPQYKSQARYAPCYLYDGNLIWGLTSYILIEFLNLGLNAKIALKTRSEPRIFNPI
jgi:8-oxo-dGTP pyrophosphatase MutT (NUDIX family)